MLSEEFVASRVYAGDVQRAEHDRELVRRLREERAERRAERAAGRRALHEARSVAAVTAEPVSAPRATGAGPDRESAPEAARDQERELAHAGR